MAAHLGAPLVYFDDQPLGAAHPKRCWKKSFSAFFFAKKLKKRKKVTNLQQNLAKNGFFILAQSHGRLLR